jgi:hypothetical protein
VLFVGDSLVFVNDLPRMLHRMAADDPGGPQIYTAQFGAGGGLLAQFAQDPRLRQLIDRDHWNHVVLQENSNVSGVADRWRQYAEPAITQIDGWARAQGATPVLFDTCGYTDGYVPGDTSGRPSSASSYTAGLPSAEARMLRSLADRDTTPLISAR